MEIFPAKLLSKSIIPEIFEKIKVNIKAPASNETYITNSGLYCFNITIRIMATKPIPYYFYNFHIIIETK